MRKAVFANYTSRLNRADICNAGFYSLRPARYAPPHAWVMTSVYYSFMVYVIIIVKYCFIIQNNTPESSPKDNRTPRRRQIARPFNREAVVDHANTHDTR